MPDHGAFFLFHRIRTALSPEPGQCPSWFSISSSPSLPFTHHFQALDAAMGFFSKSEPSEDEIQNAPPVQGAEKSVPSHEEVGAAQPTAVTATLLDPELERRVLRKLDWRVPTLTAFLCMDGSLAPTTYQREPLSDLNSLGIDLLAFLDRSNIGFVCDITRRKQN